MLVMLHLLYKVAQVYAKTQAAAAGTRMLVITAINSGCREGPISPRLSERIEKPNNCGARIDKATATTLKIIRVAANELAKTIGLNISTFIIQTIRYC